MKTVHIPAFGVCDIKFGQFPKLTIGESWNIIDIEHLFAYHEERKVFDMMCATETIVVNREGERVCVKKETREQTIHKIEVRLPQLTDEELRIVSGLIKGMRKA